MLEIILENSLTLQGVYKNLRILKEYLTSQIYGSEKQNLEKEDTEWIKQLDKTFLQQFNKENLSTEFEKIISNLEKIPILIIYFAFQPDNEQIKSVWLWLKKNYPERIILDVKTDLSLIAGCALVWKGSYKDYSLKSKIEENRQDILTDLLQIIHRT